MKRREAKTVVIIVGPTCFGQDRTGCPAGRAVERRDRQCRFHAGLSRYGHRHGQTVPGVAPSRPPSSDRHRRPDADFSASDFRREASRAISDIHGRGKKVVRGRGNRTLHQGAVAGAGRFPQRGGSHSAGTSGGGTDEWGAESCCDGSPRLIRKPLPVSTRTTRCGSSAPWRYTSRPAGRSRSSGANTALPAITTTV